MSDEIKDKEKTGLGKWMSGEGEKEEWEFIEKEKDKVIIKNTKTGRAVMATKIGDNWQVIDGEKTMLTHIGDKPIERVLEAYVKTGELPEAKEAPKRDVIPKDIKNHSTFIMTKMGFTEIESKPDLWMKKILLDEDQKEATVLWIDFRKSDKGQYWTNNPKLDSLRLKTLGEVKALKLIEDGIIDPLKWDAGKPLETVNPEGGKEFVELSWTPEEIKKEEPKEKVETPKEEETKKEIVKEGKKSMPSLEKIREIVGNDVLMIFGATGSGKSKIIVELAKEALNNGKKIFFLDSERNLSNRDIKELGNNYRYTPVFNEIKLIIENNLPKADLYILDSIGFPVLVAFSRLSLKQRGDALLTMISILGTLKERCYRENSIAIVTNQPISELSLMGKGELTKEEKDEELRPFGGKTLFGSKEIWRTDVKKGKDKTIVTLNSWRSREIGYGTTIAEVEISDKGVKFEWKV